MELPPVGCISALAWLFRPKISVHLLYRLCLKRNSKTSACCTSFNTHAAMSMSVSNMSHILRFALQSNMWQGVRQLTKPQMQTKLYVEVGLTWSSTNVSALGKKLHSTLSHFALLGFERLDYLQREPVMYKISKCVPKWGFSLSAPDAFLQQESFRKQ